MFKPRSGLSLLTGLLLLSSGAGAATLQASYTFDNSLAAQQSGVPALIATNPLGTNAFLTDTVYGASRSVYAFNGNATPVVQQAGLTFNDSAGIVSQNSYSLAMVFELPVVSGFRRVIDTQNRQSDNGVYIDSGAVRLYASGTGTLSSFTANAYHYLVLSNSGTNVTAFLDGVQQFSVADTQLNLSNNNNPGRLINLFLDNTIGSGTGEYSSGRIALFQAFEGALSGSEVATLSANPFANTTVTPPVTASAPEPASWSLAAGGLLVATYAFKRRRAERS